MDQNQKKEDTKKEENKKEENKLKRQQYKKGTKMSKKIIIPIALIAGFYLFSGKKSKKGVSIKEEEVYEGEVYDLDPEPDDEPDVEPKKPKTNVLWKNLSAANTKLIDLYINDKIIESHHTNVWYAYDIGYYQEGQDYYNWLTNQIYWDISVNKEKTTDLYTPQGMSNKDYSGTYPFLLKKGEKQEIIFTKEDGATLGIMKIDETEEVSKNRLEKDIKLWLEIKSYLKYKMPPSACQEGVICK